MPSRSRFDEPPIHTIHPEKERREPKANAYTLECEPCDPDAPEALAKRTVSESNQIRYWIKRGMVGAETGFLFNPQSPLFDELTVNRFHAALGRGKYEFREVTQEAYELYLRFLRTGNTRDLRHAERAS